MDPLESWLRHLGHSLTKQEDAKRARAVAVVVEVEEAEAEAVEEVEAVAEAEMGSQLLDVNDLDKILRSEKGIFFSIDDQSSFAL